MPITSRKIVDFFKPFTKKKPVLEDAASTSNTSAYATRPPARRTWKSPSSDTDDNEGKASDAELEEEEDDDGYDVAPASPPSNIRHERETMSAKNPLKRKTPEPAARSGGQADGDDAELSPPRKISRTTTPQPSSGFQGRGNEASLAPPPTTPREHAVQFRSAPKLQTAVKYAHRTSPVVTRCQTPSTGLPFSSMSSLTTLPDTISSHSKGMAGRDVGADIQGVSFTSNASSRRISRDGTEKILDSDGDSDGDSDDSLPDVMVLIRRHAPPPRQENPTPAMTDTDARKRSLRKPTASKAFTTPAVSTKFALSKLVSEHREREKADLEARALEDELENASVTDDERHEKSAKNGAFDRKAAEEALSSVGVKDSARVASTMKRLAETGDQDELKVRFFDAQAATPPKAPNLPISILPQDGWMALLRDKTERRQIFTSGLALQLCDMHALPPELLGWMLGHIMIGSDEQLCSSFVQVITKSQTEALSARLTATINMKLSVLGTSQKIGRWPNKIVAHQADGTKMKDVKIPRSIEYLLQLIRGLSSSFAPAEADEYIVWLARMSIDECVLSDARISLLIHDCIQVLIEAASSDQGRISQLVRTICDMVDEPALQAKLVTRLPATPAACYRLRRCVAYAWFLDGSIDLDSLSSDDASSQVLALLTGLANRVHRMDHNVLTVKAAMLDIAIGAGFSDRQFADKAEKRAFNQQIDALARSLKDLEARLLHGGHNNVAKHTARDALNRPWFRLLYALRTTPPSNNNRLIGDAEAQERGRSFFSSWVRNHKSEEGDVKDNG